MELGIYVTSTKWTFYDTSHEALGRRKIPMKYQPIFQLTSPDILFLESHPFQDQMNSIGPAVDHSFFNNKLKNREDLDHGSIMLSKKTWIKYCLW